MADQPPSRPLETTVAGLESCARTVLPTSDSFVVGASLPRDDSSFKERYRRINDSRGGGFLYSRVVSEHGGMIIAAISEPLGVHPTVLTFANLVFGVTGSLVVTLGAGARAISVTGFVGLVLWQLAYCFDCADGQLAGDRQDNARWCRLGPTHRRSGSNVCTRCLDQRHCSFQSSTNMGSGRYRSGMVDQLLHLPSQDERRKCGTFPASITLLCHPKRQANPRLWLPSSGTRCMGDVVPKTLIYPVVAITAINVLLSGGTMVKAAQMSFRATANYPRSSAKERVP